MLTAYGLPLTASRRGLTGLDSFDTKVECAMNARNETQILPRLRLKGRPMIRHDADRKGGSAMIKQLCATVRVADFPLADSGVPRVVRV